MGWQRGMTMDSSSHDILSDATVSFFCRDIVALD